MACRSKHLTKLRGLIYCFVVLFSACITLNPDNAKNSENTGKTGIMGLVVNEARQPMPDSYVYAYKSTSSKLTGPSDFMEKSDTNGSFFFELPEGKYYLIVRKRAEGGDKGPVKKGDRVAVFNNNPVVVSYSKVERVAIILPEKTELLQKKMPLGDVHVSLVITNNARKKMKVLIYQGTDIQKAPDHVLEAGEGETGFFLQSGRQYIVVVREEIKEKIGKGEFFGIYGPFAPESLQGSIEIAPEAYR